ncbi:porin [Natronohydrobacter thiooxidans]|uniref:porin n=1 Tax=Natronohydrobacter thiooxidans TaxID=87172 RepID=UPI0008FF4882|nr:porin [Natronohydrobacter thiooxidans]
MKKLLLASTALVLSAGVAAADVALSGDAWMGLRYNNALPANKTQMVSRARVTFTLSGETDGGLAFGGSFRADGATAAATEANMSQGSVFISGDFGKLTMGDVDSALEATWFRTRHIGVLEGAGGSRASALGSATTGALYEYSLDGLKVALGAGQLNNTSQNLSVGVQYKMDGFGGALGYERVKGAGDHALLSVEGGFEGITARAFYGRLKVNAGQTLAGIAGGATGTTAKQYGVDVHGSFDEIGVQARAKRGFAGENHLGLGVTYDLGGGAKVGASVNRVSAFGVNPRTTTADFGLAFTF